MPDAESSLAAALAGRYRLDRMLGEGGMATVYLAQDLKHDRPVALKVLKPELAHALGPERFEREIRLAARLQHPHILTVLDSGVAVVGQRSTVDTSTADDRRPSAVDLLFFTMPYVEGESLRARIEQERQMPIRDAVRIAREAAQALQYAHGHGIIHRDIKPDNILLTKDGSTLVADFGIARALEPGTGQTLTQTGMALGTPAYMSPEQAAGEQQIDGRTDIYSLGVVLYEMLTGEAPFTGATAQAVIAKRFSQAPPSIRTVRPSVPEALDRVVQRAMATVPGDRFSTAGAFAEALETAAESATTVAMASPQPRPMARYAILSALVLGLLIGGGALFAWRSNAKHHSGVSAAPSGDAATASAPVRIAVLPFDNLGDSADAYFADGVTDAVRGKLTALHGLEVIARVSSEQYRGSTKSPQQIADELGVDYLLTGTVRWAKAADGTSRVQVSPELIEIGDGTARSKWQQPFDAPLTDVFKVQGDIAGQVASALNVALGVADQRELAERPTQNLAAYDAYLRGAAIQGTDGVSLRRKIAFLKEAVTRDSTFGISWALLAYTQPRLGNGQSPREIADAVRRAEALAPSAPETFLARATVQYAALDHPDSALMIVQEGLAHYPGHPDLLRTKGIAELILGQVDSAIATLRRTRALDPRSLPAIRALANALASTGRFPEARAVYEQGLAVDSADLRTLQALVNTYLLEGDLAGARQLIARVAASVDRKQFYAYLSLYNDYYWVLDRSQQDTVLALPASYFDEDASGRAVARAEIYRQRGDSAAMRAWADTARRLLAPAAHEPASDPQYQAMLGLMEAYLGHTEAARREVTRATQRSLASKSLSASYVSLVDARTRAVIGDVAGAVNRLAEAPAGPLLEITPAILPLVPDLAPLRGNPRFEKLIARSPT